MQFDPEADSEVPVPDHVPDELNHQYGSSARRTVRRSRTWRYPVARRLRPLRAIVRDGDLWLAVLSVFAWSVVAVGALGALVYLAILVPIAALTVVVPLVAIFGLSVFIAVRVVRRDAVIESEQTAL